MAKRRRNPYVQRYLRYPLEAAGVYLTLFILRRLPIDWASNLLGWLGRLIGPRLGVTRRARRNLKLAFPEKNAAERVAIVAAMWDNLGRTAGEYAHMVRIADPASGRVEIAGEEYLADQMKGTAPAVLFTGHFANWEIMGLTSVHLGLQATTVVRRPNNPLVEGVLESLRGAIGGRRVYKGSGGARDAVTALKEGRVLAMLVDQKLNDGIAVPFFGQPAMTAPAAAQLALRFGCPLIPARTERLGPGRFRISAHPPLTLPDSGDRKADTAQAMAEVNRILENWIRERPGEWFWLHRRWPKGVYGESGD